MSVGALCDLQSAAEAAGTSVACQPAAWWRHRWSGGDGCRPAQPSHQGILSRRLDSRDAVLSGVAFQSVRLVLELFDVQLDIRAASRDLWSRPLGSRGPLSSDSVDGRDRDGGRYPACAEPDRAHLDGDPRHGHRRFGDGDPGRIGKAQGLLRQLARDRNCRCALAFAYLGTVDARSFNLDRSFEVMFIIILGGMGSIIGNYLARRSWFSCRSCSIMSYPVRSAAAIDAGQLENFQKALSAASSSGS